MSAPARRRNTVKSNEFADSSNKSSGPLADPTGSDCADARPRSRRASWPFAGVGSDRVNITAKVIRQKPAGANFEAAAQGVHPSELPIQQAERFEFVLNLKAAATLGLKVPPGLLVRADEVIE
jgi:hypothetical protein